MSQSFEIVLPKLGESILSATIVRWFKKEGEFVKRDEPLLEVATDKVSSEIPSPASGVLTKIHAMVDQEIDVGAILAVLAIDEQIEGKTKPSVEKADGENSQRIDNSQYYSPALIAYAKERGISMEILQTIKGSGHGGRVSRQDLEQYVLSKGPCSASTKSSLVDSEPQGDVEHVKMSHLRKAIADNMVRSFYQAPHASLITEVDVTHLIDVIAREKEAFWKKHQAKLTITSFVVRAMTQALYRYPLLNSSLKEDTIVVKHFVNVGIAVSVDQGVVVPVIKGCHRLSLVEIAKELGNVAAQGKNQTLESGQMQGGTITLTNFGMTGIEMGIPIIRYPEVAIIGLGSITKKAIVTPSDEIRVGRVAHICLTFDHRVLDGIYGCGFLSELKKILQEDISIS